MQQIGFYCRTYCSLNMFRAPLCPSSGAQDLYTWLLSMVLGALVYRSLVWCGAVGYVSGLRDAAASRKPDTWQWQCQFLHLRSIYTYWTRLSQLRCWLGYGVETEESEFDSGKKHFFFVQPQNQQRIPLSCHSIDIERSFIGYKADGAWRWPLTIF